MNNQKKTFRGQGADTNPFKLQKDVKWWLLLFIFQKINGQCKLTFVKKFDYLLLTKTRFALFGKHLIRGQRTHFGSTNSKESWNVTFWNPTLMDPQQNEVEFRRDCHPKDCLATTPLLCQTTCRHYCRHLCHPCRRRTFLHQLHFLVQVSGTF